jgi:hypothetical protein
VRRVGTGAALPRNAASRRRVDDRRARAASRRYALAALARVFFVPCAPGFALAPRPSAFAGFASPAGGAT